MKKKSGKDPLEPVRTAPLKVKDLCLNPALLGHSGIAFEAVPAFPREILACKNVETLDLFRTISWDGDPTIPKEIGTLKKLRKLCLGGNGFTSLPDAIGDLQQLQELELDYAESLAKLPETIGKLSKLETLSLGYTALTGLPKSIGKLQKLKRLAISSDAMKTIPKEVWDLGALESLALPEGVTKLPPGISRLKSLRELSVAGRALSSIASELPKLAKLEVLSTYVAEHDAKIDGLPEEVGRIPKLRELSISFCGTKSLPASLMGHAALEKLDVAGNAIQSLEALVASLPKLKELDFSDNPIDRGEKRRIDAMMKLPPNKRRVGQAAPAAKHAPGVEIGTVMSINASLSMVIADVSIASAWRGAADEDDSDYDRLMKVLDGRDVGKIRVGKKDALALSLGVGQGVAHLFRVMGGIAIVEGFAKSWRDAALREDVGAPPKGKKSGVLEVTTGKVVITPGTDGCGDVARMKKSPEVDGRALTCGDDRSSAIFALPKGRYDVFVEDERNASWGSARRALLLRA